MTREEILAMKPGRELDAEIALRVLGVKEITVVGKHYFVDPLEKVLPAYSTDISAAWEVVETFDISTFNLNWLGRYNIYGEGWHCKLDDAHSHNCKTAPEAICKAALLAVLAE